MLPKFLKKLYAHAVEETGIEKARQTLGEIVNRAQYKNEPTLITRQGKAVAVVISVEQALGAWGIAATTIGGGEYARLRRELRELVNGVPSDCPDAPQVPQGEEAGAL